MPFIIRDEAGHIAGFFSQPVEGGEEIDENDEELHAFLREAAPSAVLDEQWVQSDLALTRVLEDLVDILIDKNIIKLTDFPVGAQRKLLERREFREEFASIAGLFGDPEDDEFGSDDNDIF